MSKEEPVGRENVLGVLTAMTILALLLLLHCTVQPERIAELTLLALGAVVRQRKGLPGVRLSSMTCWQCAALMDHN